MRNLHCGMFGAAFALVVCASPVQAQPYGYGMMGGYGPGWMMGPGMMGGYGPGYHMGGGGGPGWNCPAFGGGYGPGMMDTATATA